MRLAKGSSVTIYSQGVLRQEADLPSSHGDRVAIKVKIPGSTRAGWTQSTVPISFLHDAKTFTFHQPTGRELPFRFAESTKDTDQAIFLEALMELAKKQGIVLESLK